jgi:WD40 repeat protein
MSPIAHPFEALARVFISYARSDGEVIASDLRTRLGKEHPEITLWMDRSRMVGGVGWWKQITEALDHVEILIMVLTPGALQSDTAAKEWRYARQQGVRVCPVMQSPDGLKFESLPGWMRKSHCYNLSREWERFVSYLYSEGRDNRVPFMAPDLPHRYVPRPAEFQALLAQLLDESGDNARAVTTALHGAGGFGKTTLACMLCHDEKLITAFDDGILWVSLGEAPNLQGELTKLYAALTGERPPFIDIEDAAIQLGTRLDQKNCLLVIDDVWDPNHLKPFLRGGAHCARLVTTRQLSVLSETPVVRTLIDRMTDEEAVRLLAARIEPSAENFEALTALAERLGHWPLLLKLVGSQLRERIERGDSVQGALAYAERAMDKRGIVAFDRTNRSTRNDAVASTVAASLDLFSAEDQLRCTQLAIFRSDSAIPLSAVSVLWRVDALDAEDLLLRLDDAALLEFDLKVAAVRLHNVLRAYFTTRIAAPQALHAGLAECWLDDPRELPDAYAWTWIGWHLAQAGQHNRLRQLLLDYGWLKARLAKVPHQITLQDFDLIEDDDDVPVVRDALRLASDGLTFDAGQLRAQLRGRIDSGRAASIDRMLEEADESEPIPRLTLVDTSLTHPGGALTAIMKAHAGAVEALAVSADGRWFVSGSQDWTLRLWDLETNSVVRIFEGHNGTVHSVAFTPDGQSILSGSEDRTLRLWNVATAQVLQTFKGHTLAVRGLVIGAGGNTAYSASEDGSVREWNLLSRQTRTLFRGRSHQLGPLAVCTDAQRLIFGTGDWKIAVLDLTGSSAIRILEGHSGIVRSVSVTPDGAKMLSGGDDGVVRLWALDSGAALLELRGHDAAVEAVVISSDGTRAVSASQDRTLRVWDLATAETLQVLKGHSGFVRSVAFAVPTRHVVSGSTDRTIRRWNVEPSPADRSVDGHAEAVSRLALSSNGELATSGSGGSDLLVWRVAGLATAPRPLRSSGRLEGHTDRIHVVELVPDGTRAVTGSRDRTLRVWDLGKLATSYVLRGHTREIVDLQISADGRRVVSLSRDHTVRVWDIASGRPVRALVSVDNERALASLGVGSALVEELETMPTVDISSRPIPRDPRVALAPNGTCVVLGSQGNVCVWDLQAGALQYQDLGDLDIVAVEFGGDSRRVVLGSLFGPLLVWRFEGAPVLLEGHTGRILDVIVTPDGATAISAASDDTICIWDLDGERQKHRLHCTVGHPDAVAIAPYGNVAYSVYGHALVAWDLVSRARIGSLSFDHQITTLSVTPAGTQVAVGDLSGRVHFLMLQL